MLKRFLIIAVIVGIAYFAWQRFMPQGGFGGQPGGAPPVSVAEVIERDVQQWHEFSGKLVAVDQVEIRPRVSGVIEQVHFKDGAVVKKGDMLFTIDPRPYEAAMQAAIARATLANNEFRRAQTLLAEKAIPQRDFDQRRNDAEVAKADLTRAELDLGYTHIKSPIAGRTGRAEITAGNLVEAGGGAPVLTTVVSSTPIYADFEIDEATYLQYAQAKTTGDAKARKIPVMMGLSGETDTSHNGHIQSFDNRLDNASGTVRVRAVFDNGDGVLVPGLFARIRLGTPMQTKALLITDRAVGTDQNKKFVLVVGTENKVEYREVKLDGLVDGLRVVNEGLKPGDKIIVNGLQRARPGTPVTPEVVPMEDTGEKKPEEKAEIKESQESGKEEK